MTPVALSPPLDLPVSMLSHAIDKAKIGTQHKVKQTSTPLTWSFSRPIQNILAMFFFTLAFWSLEPDITSIS